MSILCDSEIKTLCGTQGMIKPFVDHSVRETPLQGKILSYGLSSYGYDVRLGYEFKLFSNANGALVDPKQLDPDCLVDAHVREDAQGSEYVILPPNSYLLGVTEEYFHIPRDITVVCVGKSTMARAGVVTNVTPIEAGFKGNVVLELSNGSTLPVKIYVGEGIAQFLFFKGTPCTTSYADRQGKYQGQTGLTLGRV